MDGEHDVADVLDGFQAAEAAHVIELAALGIEAAAGIAVVRGERAFHLQDGEADTGDFHGVEQHLILHGAAAKAGIIGHTGDGFVLGLDDPVLKRFEFHGRAVGAFQHVTVDEAGRRGQRGDGGRDAGGQAKAGEAVEDLLTGEVVVRAIAEGHDDIRQAVQRNGALGGHARDAVHADFHGYGDKAFHLFGGVAGPLGDELHHGRREIGIGIHRQAVQGARAGADQHERHEDDEKALAQGGGDNPVHGRGRARLGCGRGRLGAHWFWRNWTKMAPSTTIWSPGCRPSAMSY